MVHSLVTLAYNLQIFEGIETEEQLHAITRVGGNEVQGYLLGKPAPDPASQLTPPELQQTNSLCLQNAASKAASHA
jgi:EAL domain-containing protein (putative c-di-GMP-specific phosphodiesterase class I)